MVNYSRRKIKINVKKCDKQSNVEDTKISVREFLKYAALMSYAKFSADRNNIAVSRLPKQTRPHRKMNFSL